MSVALIGYGLGALAGNALAGRVAPIGIVRVLPIPVGVLAGILLAQGWVLCYQPLALLCVVLLGGATFVVVPLVHTWLMGTVGPVAAGLAAGLSLAWISPIAALPVLAATAVSIALRRQTTRSATGATETEPAPVK